MVVKQLTLKAEMSGLRALKKRSFAGADVVRLIFAGCIAQAEVVWFIKRQSLGTQNTRDLS